MMNRLNLYKKNNILKSLVLCALFTVVNQAHAALLERTIVVDGGPNVDAYYDDVLDITWLKNANFMETTDWDGNDETFRNWADAKTWVAQLSIGEYDDWRLPSVQPLDAIDGFDYYQTLDGSTDVGYNSTSEMHELAYMFYANLGLESRINSNNTWNSRWVDYNFYEVNTQSLGNRIDIDSFYSAQYWYDEEYEAKAGNAWVFDTRVGRQVGLSQTLTGGRAWAVRDGDVASAVTSEVPEPASVFLFASALLGCFIRRQKKFC
ncbi:PEP-CTERM sorting domain-containing protein [Thalassomonas sp. RHCl1]|uniref:PEP-CTERM sorting domain-containing protein n=1 Tax=Thalassomonas sp. RHCl1 TaxID=2995320 RepID=UPI00248B8FF6|nr:PEP-CTERM sorting domain-containing protein [Thalassomonas sp. RHCl1]